MNPIPVLDAHVHFWNPTRLSYPWLGSVPALNRVWEPENFAVATQGLGVEGFVFVECGRDPAQNVDEAAWVALLARSEPRLRGIVAHASLERGAAAVRSELEALSRIPLVRGVRRLLQDEADGEFCLRPDFVDGVRALEEFGFSFDLCIYHDQMPAVLELVRRCPGVTFILDHLGKPGIRESRIDPWRSHLRELAAFPKVWCKISGITTEADHARWASADLRPYLEHALDCFGFHRSMYGGDWPVSTLATTYSRWLGEVQSAVADRSEAERRALFHENASRCYRLVLAS